MRDYKNKSAFVVISFTVLAFILFFLLKASVWAECRDAGFSWWYCFNLISR